MKILTKMALALSGMALVMACENTDVVDSGTYTGTISEVEAAKTEIYVKTADDKTLELYFTEETELTRDGSPADFSELKEDMKVEVTVEKVGKRLDPKAVKIMQ